jgi:HD superfamily phosphodiesterase
MTYNTTLVHWASECATSLLEPLGNRWLHVQGVVEKARIVGKTLNEEENMLLVAAAYLHDIGYAPSLKKTGFHPLDGAYYLHSLGYDRLASLVAHHSGACFEARLRGYGEELDAFSREHSATADALAYCDLTTGPTGCSVSFKQRLADVFERYGESDIVSRSLRQGRPYLSLAVARTTHRLRKYGLA